MKALQYLMLIALFCCTSFAHGSLRKSVSERVRHAYDFVKEKTDNAMAWITHLFNREKTYKSSHEPQHTEYK